MLVLVVLRTCEQKVGRTCCLGMRLRHMQSPHPESCEGETFWLGRRGVGVTVKREAERIRTPLLIEVFSLCAFLSRCSTL